MCCDACGVNKPKQTHGTSSANGFCFGARETHADKTHVTVLIVTAVTFTCVRACVGRSIVSHSAVPFLRDLREWDRGQRRHNRTHDVVDVDSDGGGGGDNDDDNNGYVHNDPLAAVGRDGQVHCGKTVNLDRITRTKARATTVQCD